MQPPYPPRPPYPPLPGPAGESDPALLARLGGPDADGHRHAVALLLARHWRATLDHAVVCLAVTGPTAQLVAAAAFQQVLTEATTGVTGRAEGTGVGGSGAPRVTGTVGVPGMPRATGVTGGALRPRLLVAVRDTVRTWAADDAVRTVLPELRKTTGGRGLRATKPGPAESRWLAAHAFRSLPSAAQCLLWHTEVEAEPINIPAGLLGIDTVTATAALERAREQFRAGCLRAHRELAPTEECRFHNRLLDIPLRRGGPLLPEVRRHLTVCPHCRYAAEQLGHFDTGLPLLLAESVLGWGARRYLGSRPARAAREDRPSLRDRPGRHDSRGSRDRHIRWTRVTAPRGPLSAGRHRKAMAIGVGLASLALLVTALSVRSWSDDNGVPGPGAPWAAPVADSPLPGGADAHSAASYGDPAATVHGTLRGLASGRCLDVRGERVAAGAGVRLAPCSAAGSQQWTYQDDGLLRSTADPALCLTADPATGTVALAGCAVPPGEVSYDVTLHGEILLRHHPGLALAPGPARGGTAVGVVHRDDGSLDQRWALEPEPDEAPPAGAGAGPGRRPVAPGPSVAPSLPGASGASGGVRGGPSGGAGRRRTGDPLRGKPGRAGQGKGAEERARPRGARSQGGGGERPGRAADIGAREDVRVRGAGEASGRRDPGVAAVSGPVGRSAGPARGGHDVLGDGANGALVGGNAYRSRRSLRLQTLRGGGAAAQVDVELGAAFPPAEALARCRVGGGEQDVDDPRRGGGRDGLPDQVRFEDADGVGVDQASHAQVGVVGPQGGEVAPGDAGAEGIVRRRGVDVVEEVALDEAVGDAGVP
ncbi:hypothetical protein SUDANB170_06129 [Streptomyces sp. enrichment culture]